MAVNNAVLINQTSGKCEYYTPSAIIDAARMLMGGIDLDPASSAKANETVKATRFYTAQDDGLSKPWVGRIWLNHPFGRTTNKPFIDKLVEQAQCGNVTQACCITFACTSEKWFAPLLAWPQFFFTGRTNYRLPDGRILSGVTKGSVVTYLYPAGTTYQHALAFLGAKFACFEGVAK